MWMIFFIFKVSNSSKLPWNVDYVHIAEVFLPGFLYKSKIHLHKTHPYNFLRFYHLLQLENPDMMSLILVYNKTINYYFFSKLQTFFQTHKVFYSLVQDVHDTFCLFYVLALWNWSWDLWNVWALDRLDWCFLVGFVLAMGALYRSSMMRGEAALCSFPRFIL